MKTEDFRELMAEIAAALERLGKENKRRDCFHCKGTGRDDWDDAMSVAMSVAAYRERQTEARCAKCGNRHCQIATVSLEMFRDPLNEQWREYLAVSCGCGHFWSEPVEGDARE